MATVVGDKRLFRLEQLAMRETSRAMATGSVAKIDLPGYRVRAANRIMSLPLPIAHVLLGRQIARARGGKSPTLRGDVQGGRPSEIDYLNGVVAKFGNEVGVAVPVNAALTHLVREVTESPESRAWYRHNTTHYLEEMVRLTADPEVS